MSERLIVEIDTQGRLVIPSQLAKRLGISQGTIFVVERETSDVTYMRVEHPNTAIIEKDGVLVVSTTDSHPIANVLDIEREQHLTELWERPHARIT